MVWIPATVIWLAPLLGAAEDWSGEWVTDLGRMQLEQKGGSVEGTYGDGGRVEGDARGDELKVRWTNGGQSGSAKLELAGGGGSFSGEWTGAGGGGKWRGWRKDPDAESAPTADFSGTWVSSLGNLVLEQNGRSVEGTWGNEGWASIEGEVTGRRMQMRWKRIQWSGDAWFEMTAEGGRFFGLTDETPPVKWLGLRVAEFVPDAAPKAGEIVSGLSENHIFYFLRAPDGWRKGKKADAVVLLHGSNWTTKGMVWVTAQNWPELAKECFIIGIQGQDWADWSDADDLRHNYTYVNWMGRSTYQGYPNTDRESPYLVKQVIEELTEECNLERIFLGGHSQGGFLSYILYMHHPELFAGVFPIAGGLVIQAEPDVFEDEKLLAAQRATPLAIVHGTEDQLVPFSTGEYIHERFLASGFPMLRFFAPDLGHGYDFLPVGEAVAWLSALSTDDSKELALFAQDAADEDRWRDVGAALARAEAIRAQPKLKAVMKKLDAAAAKDAERFQELIAKDADGSWIDEFLDWRDQFEFAPAAAGTMKAFYRLRDEHDEPAEKLIGEARAAFQRGNREVGWASYEKVVREYYAARRYRNVKKWLADR